MITDWIEPIAMGMEFFFRCTYLALPLAALVFAVDLLAGRFIAGRYRCLLWMLVAVRMLAPVTVESSLSLHNLWTSDATAMAIANDKIAMPVPVSVADCPQEPGAEVAPASPDSDTKTGPDGTRYSTMEPAAQAPIQADVWAWVTSKLFPLLWLLGAVVLVGRPILAAIRFTWSLRRCEEITDQSTVDILLRVCDRSGAGRRPKLKIVPELQTPAVFGLLRPTICLPSSTLDGLSPNQLEMVLHHEVAHVRRRDALAAWLATTVRALHWMNPLAWLVHWKIMQLMEQSCDEAVLRYSQGLSARSYGELLMQLAADITPCRQQSALGLSFVRPKQRLRSRLKQLTQVRRRNTWSRQIVGLALLLATAATGFTDAKTIHPQPSVKQRRFIAAGYQLPMERKSEPLEDRVYDVKSALVQLKHALPETDAKEAMSLFLPVVFTGEFDNKINFAGQLAKGELTVTAPERVQHQVAASLDAMSRSGPWKIDVSIHLISAPLDAALTSTIPWRSQGVVSELPNVRSSVSPPLRVDESDWPRRVDGRLRIQSEPMLMENRPFVAVKITKEQQTQLLSQLQADSRTIDLQAPKITVFNGQTAVVSDEAQSPFVVSVIPVREDMAIAMQPVIDVLNDGVRIALRAVISEDDHCELQCRISESTIGDVGVASLPLVDSPKQHDMRIQTPRCSGTTAMIACRLMRSQSLLVASPQPMSSDSNANQRSPARFYLIETAWNRPGSP